MLIGREEELAYLNEWVKKRGIRILILYGQKGIGKTTLLNHFLKGKNGFYYEAVPCSSRQQRIFWRDYLHHMDVNIAKNSDYEEIFFTMLKAGKKIWVIDEFQHLGKNDVEFFEFFCEYFSQKEKETDLLLILSSSSIGWTENILEEKLKNYFFSSDVYYEKKKLEELKYKDMKKKFPGFSLMDSIGVYSILGGNPGVWQIFSDKYTLKENVERLLWQKGKILFESGQQYVEEELREPAVYNTILTMLAGGKCKLNEIHQATGFSRAKISVYLKNLMHLDLVEKVVSIDTKGRENTQKGIYRINNSYIRFYYKYIFPNRNSIGILEKEKIYDALIAPSIEDFIESGFKKICIEFLELENVRKRLPEDFSYLGEWVGKKGKLDFIFTNEDKEIMTGICSWKKENMRYDDYKIFMECLESAKIEAEYMIIFSRGKFDNNLRQEAKKNPYLALVSAEQVV